MPLPVSPLAPDQFPDLPHVAGVGLATGHAGIRYPASRDDVLVARLAPGTQVAGVFTTSHTASAAVAISRDAIASAGGQATALLVVAGNSIAGTGAAGDAATRALIASTAQASSCPNDQVQFAATGVIGEPFPVARMSAVLPDLCGSAAAALAAPDTASAAALWQKAARAICTTDTFPKGASATAMLDGRKVTLAGIVKGSGMIMPNMATMLGYIFTDAAIPAPVLATLLRRATATSFNSITVDSDTSTSDTVLLFATGQVSTDSPLTSADDARLDDFRAALNAVCLNLALQVVRDGEGAQKLITIAVRGAASDSDAHVFAMSIANSPLVKTAIAGGDANWGRIVMAVGKAGPAVRQNDLDIAFGGHLICRGGERVADYDERPVADHLAGRDVQIDVCVGTGPGTARVYTCDLTHGYIDINADYRS